MKGVLLVNLGSPDSPSVPDVRRYLREFLMDGRVLDINWLARFCLVHFAILPSRPKQSAEAYEKIWTPEGSPLVVTSRKVQAKLQERVQSPSSKVQSPEPQGAASRSVVSGQWSVVGSPPIELAMRYQHPSIPDAIGRLAEKGVTDLLLIPLFPHYAMSSFETAVARVKEVAATLAPAMRIQVQPPYYDHPDYIQALVASAQPFLGKNYDHLLFSFHGIPERQLRKSDPTGSYCLTTPDCCRVVGARTFLSAATSESQAAVNNPNPESRSSVAADRNVRAPASTPHQSINPSIHPTTAGDIHHPSSIIQPPASPLATCYRAQCFKTVAAFVSAANIPPKKYSVSFQSRLGRTPWLKPYTDYELPRLAAAGCKNILVICPSFVSDCLETLEEIGIRGRATFLEAGGNELTLIPCLNEHPLWIEALARWIQDWLKPVLL
ncbi:MAG: ferrochelatase [Verrucomicrobia bacterium]|nr:MAG: ferrochelatase [Verrucomicrobiota bacterium]